MKYKKVQLKDIADIVMGQSPKSQFYNTDGKGIPFLQGVRTFGENYPIIDTYTTSFNREANVGEILFSVRAPVGRVNWATKRIAIGRGLAAIRVKERYSPNYLYYLFKKIGEHLDSLATGTVFTSINKKELSELSIDIPASVVDQERVANYLKKIDLKIEKNNQINDNLDALLTTIFEEKVKNSGFDEAKLTDIANYKNGLAMQKYRPKNNESSLPVLKIKELNQGYTDNSSDRCSTNIDKGVIVNQGDIIFSWSGTLLVKNWSGKTAGLNQHLFKVTSNQYPDWFIYEWTKHYLKKFQLIASGKATTLGHIKRNDLKLSKVFIPNKDTLNEYNTQLKPLYDKRIAIIKETQCLNDLKQTLLQKYF